ncbi:hypothetical protein BOTBODRAFT_33689 [Botryobasidium botryosum FD-172 SS1]|uniref:Protein kinase domain-containing protein n=1 Tax=Botryobasidium botryosum (strain FD-172 SS1) TaxID=930990 RepID=A0A067MCA7_BOTB1|nr:hypothetical protein BOTBODRAFT_33689 [Botryobasidium botryosum FD-172 SS1]
MAPTEILHARPSRVGSPLGSQQTKGLPPASAPPRSPPYSAQAGAIFKIASDLHTSSHIARTEDIMSDSTSQADIVHADRRAASSSIGRSSATQGQLRTKDISDEVAQPDMKCGSFRVLILGRANSGKTTLLQAACGATGNPEVLLEDVHDHNEDIVLAKNALDNDDRGLALQGLLPSTAEDRHDIMTPLVYPSTPGFVFHDSQGFEADGSKGLEIVTNFIKHRRDVKNQLDAIWYCIPTDNGSQLLSGPEQELLRQCSIGSVPLIVIFTKFDILEEKAFHQLRRAGVTSQQAQRHASQLAIQEFQRYCLPHVFGKEYPLHMYLGKMHEEQNTAEILRKMIELIQITLHGAVQKSQISQFEPKIYGTMFAQGGYSECFLGTFLERNRIALKRLRVCDPHDPEREIKLIFHECRVWQELRHPNILPFLGLAKIDSINYMVSPFMKNGNVLDYLRKSPDIDRLKLIAQIASGIRYLHNHAPLVIHGDIRSANVLVNDCGDACISDFGLSEICENETPVQRSTAWVLAGNLRWQSPEIITAEMVTEARRTTASDVFSFGRTMYEVRQPFYISVGLID